MTSWADDVAHNMVETIWKNRDNWPAPIACTDGELQAWWEEALEKYNLYCRIIERETARCSASDSSISMVITEMDVNDKDEWTWSTSVDTDPVPERWCFSEAELGRLYERVAEMEAELEAIDYEWGRRPWNKQKQFNK